MRRPLFLLIALLAAAFGTIAAVPAPHATLTQPIQWLTELIARHGIGWGLMAAFVGGLFLNLTPCVYPMIPVTLAFFSHQAAGSWRHLVWLACCYVAGLSLTYAVLGLVAARTGALFGSWLQQPLVLMSMALLIVGLAMSMFGLYELRLPRILMRRFDTASAGAGGALVMGIVLGLVAAPCVGPFVLGLLLVVGEIANPFSGFLLLFMLGLGMGLPCVVLGVTASHVSHLPKAGAWLVWTKHALGCILLGLAVFFLTPLLSGMVTRLAVTALLLASGVYLGWLARIAHQGRRFRVIRHTAGVLLVAAAVLAAWPTPHAGPAVPWVSYSERAIAEARRAQRPVVVDIYADWCLPCLELDRVTFRHADVIRALQSVETLRVDVTRDPSPEAQALLARYGIVGVPTVMFFDAQGREREELRLSGFEPPGAFLRRLKQIQ